MTVSAEVAMINLEFKLENGQAVMLHDVHPASQEQGGIEIPPGAVRVTVWLGTRPVNGVQG